MPGAQPRQSSERRLRSSILRGTPATGPGAYLVNRPAGAGVVLGETSDAGGGGPLTLLDVGLTPFVFEWADDPGVANHSATIVTDGTALGDLSDSTYFQAAADRDNVWPRWQVPACDVPPGVTPTVTVTMRCGWSQSDPGTFPNPTGFNFFNMGFAATAFTNHRFGAEPGVPDTTGLTGDGMVQDYSAAVPDGSTVDESWDVALHDANVEYLRQGFLGIYLEGTSTALEAMDWCRIYEMHILVEVPA